MQVNGIAYNNNQQVSMKYVYFLLCVVFLIISLLIYRENNDYADRVHAEKFFIICTTTMLADAVRIVGGDYVDVVPLMGPGVDPHLYRARESDIYRIAQADLILYHGLHLEGKLAHLFAGMQRYVPAVAVCEQIPDEQLRASDVEGIYDPHVWHAVRLWMTCVQKIAEILIYHDPAHADEYRCRAEQYMQELNALDQWIHQEIASIPVSVRCLVTAHDAFSYFGQQYGLEVVSLQGISTESDIGTYDVITLVHYLVEHRIPVMFVEASIPTRTIQAVQEAAEDKQWYVAIGDSLYSDSLGDKKSGADTYVHMIQHNVRAIVSGLMGDRSSHN